MVYFCTENIQKEVLIEFIISNMIYVGIASRRSILSLTFKAPQVSDQTMEFSMFISLLETDSAKLLHARYFKMFK